MNVGSVSRRAAVIELTVFLSHVLTFIWLFNGRYPFPNKVIHALALCFTVSTHFIHRESLSDLGLSLRNLGPALRDAAIPVVPIVTVFTVMGIVGGTWSMDALDPWRFARVFGWGFTQQYVLQCYIHRRVAVLVKKPLHRELVVSAIFSALHLPNPVLVPVTFLAGFVFSLLYRRHPNIYVLALSHALGSTAVAFGFSPDVLHKMRVGPGYFHVHSVR